jgi:hypothetical protein
MRVQGQALTDYCKEFDSRLANFLQRSEEFCTAAPSIK